MPTANKRCQEKNKKERERERERILLDIKIRGRSEAWLLGSIKEQR
jgi:hypothetical protein